jgi:hypothetical protein
LAIPKDEQFTVSDDGSTRAVKIIFPELGIGARCPSVGKIGFVGGTILIRTTPVEPPGDIGDGGRGYGEDGPEGESSEIHEHFHTRFRGGTLNLTLEFVK